MEYFLMKSTVLVFWLTMFFFSIGGAIRLCLLNWERYIANPTVVSLEKDYKNWLNPFPGATGCLIIRVDKEKGADYIRKKWSVTEEDPKYGYYLEFLKAVANISYFTMSNFTKFQNDTSLNNIDFLDLAIKVHPKLDGDLVCYDTKRSLEWTMVSTEFGLCITTNTKTAPLFAISGITNKTAYNIENLLKCHFLNGMCYARYDSDPEIPVNYYVHSPYEILHTTSAAPLYLPEKSEKEINFDMQETRASLSLRRLSVSQRNCRFYDEPEFPDVPSYSIGICNVLCRYRHALKLCGCKPFFYHKLDGPVCDIDGMICLSKHVDFLTKSAKEMDCQCLQPCWVINYLKHSIKANIWVGGYFEQRVTVRWALLHPKTRYKRDVLFGFEDLVVAFGGIGSLCFGMSFISVMDIVIFFIKQIIYRIFPKKFTETEKILLENRNVDKPISFFKSHKIKHKPDVDFSRQIGFDHYATNIPYYN